MLGDGAPVSRAAKVDRQFRIRPAGLGSAKPITGQQGSATACGWAARPNALLGEVWSSRPSKLAKCCASSARKISVMNTRNFESSSPASQVYSFRRTRTFIAKILIRLSYAYADLARWIAPWLMEED